MQFINRNKIGKIFFISLLLFFTIFLYVKTDSLAQEPPKFFKELNIHDNVSYTLKFKYFISEYEVRDLVSIKSLNVNKEEVEYEPTIQMSANELIFTFDDWNDELDTVQLEILVDLQSEEYVLSQGAMIKFFKENEPSKLEANFYVNNGLVGLEWDKQEGQTYEVYSLDEPYNELKHIPNKATLVAETTGNFVDLSDAYELNNNLSYVYYVVAKENNHIVSISEALLTATLVNRVPISIIDSMPKEIMSLKDFPEAITVEMFGGIITELPVYYEELSDHTITYSIINTPIRNEKISISNSVRAELEEEFTYRQMMYPTYYSYENNKLTIQEEMIAVEMISPMKNKEVTLNNLLLAPTRSEEEKYVTTMLEDRNNVIDLSSYTNLLDAAYLEDILHSLAQKESYFYDIKYVGLDQNEEELYIVYNDEVESREIIKEKVKAVTSELDGSLESIYAFLVTDYIFANQSSKLTAYAFLLLAEQFNYEVSVKKVTEYGATTYWNEIILDDEVYYVDVSKNIMTTGMNKEIFIIKPTELIQYGVQSY